MDTVEQAGMHAERAPVVVEKLDAMRFVGGVAGLEAEADADQAARARGRHAAQWRERHRGHAAIGAHLVERGGQIRRGVGKGAVEVEQDAANHGRVACSM